VPRCNVLLKKQKKITQEVPAKKPSLDHFGCRGCATTRLLLLLLCAASLGRVRMGGLAGAAAPPAAPSRLVLELAGLPAPGGTPDVLASSLRGPADWLPDPRKAELMRACQDWVKSEIAACDASHDWCHVHRVRRQAIAIAEAEELEAKIPGGMLVVELAALLHDVKDYKYSGSDTAGIESAAGMHVRKHVCARSRAHAGIHARTHAHGHAHTHTHTLTRPRPRALTHTQPQSSSKRRMSHPPSLRESSRCRHNTKYQSRSRTLSVNPKVHACTVSFCLLQTVLSRARTGHRMCGECVCCVGVLITQTLTRTP